MDIAQAAFAAFSKADALAVISEVSNDFVSVEVADKGADGHFEDDVVRPCAVAVGAVAFFAVFGLVAFDEAVFDEGVGVFVGFCPNAAAFAAVAAVRPPRGTNFSRRKLVAPLPPLPAATSIFCFVDKFHDVLLWVFGCFRRPLLIEELGV